MKIKDIFEVEQIEDKSYMVCLDSTVFAGMVELNETAAFIVSCMKEETTSEEIAAKMAQTYEVAQEEALRGVEEIVSQLKQLQFIEDGH